MNVSKMIRSLGVVCALGLAGLLLAGCKGPQFAEIPGVGSGTGAAISPKGEAPTPTSTLDIIRAGDTLLVTFSDLPYRQEPIEDRVRDDGTIMLIQNLSFRAAERSRSDLEKEIHDAYVPKYFQTMTVSVSPKASTQFYYVDGEVKRPDRQVYIGRLTVTKAIASANGFTDFARKRALQLVRVDGRKYTINFMQALKDPKLDLEVYPGDKIYVPRRNPLW
jgi:polysaccharide export outer membrane protein